MIEVNLPAHCAPDPARLRRYRVAAGRGAGTGIIAVMTGHIENRESELLL